MSEYIKREDAIALIEAIKKANENEPQSEYHIGYTDALNYVIDTLYANEDNAIPSAYVEPVRHGHWIEKNTNKDGTHNIYCNECGKYIKSKGHANSWNVRHKLLYCPNCGAKMDDKEQEHEHID